MKKIIPIRPRSSAELENLLQKIGSKADIIEIWLDRNADELIPVIKKIRSETYQAPDAPKFLAVCKTPEEKGIFLGSMEQKLLILQKFLDAGGDYIDVDFGRFPIELTNQLPNEKLW
jgi:3-dehydroquinate dehydratase